MVRVAAYAGSFDPPTLGHLDVISKVASLFDTIHVVVAHNVRKSSLFSGQERRELLLACQREGLLPENSKIHLFDGLLADFCEAHDVHYLVRGLRAVSDYENELQIATMNRKLKKNLETLLVMADEKHFFVSSSLVKEVAYHGGPLDEMVPRPVVEALKKKYKRNS
jgi:pantetheine-phosphate adenylyltransferase